MAGATLDGLESKTIAAVLAQTSRRRVLRNGWVFLEGDRSDEAYLIDEGLLKLVKTGEDGSEVVVAIRGAGEIVGELSALDDLPRLVGAVAVVETRVSGIKRDRLIEMIREYPDLALSMLANLTGQLRRTTNHLVALAAADANVLVARRLWQLATSPTFSPVRSDCAGTTVIRSPLSQHELADWAGVSHRSAAAVLQQLRDDGIISTSRLRLEIHDISALRTLAEEA